MTSDRDLFTDASDPARSALLMWDFQVGLAGRARRRDDLVAVARQLLDAADACGVPVVWSRHTLPSPEGLTLGMRAFQMRKQGVSSPEDLRPFMRPGSPEREFLPELAPREHDIVVVKSSPSFFVGSTLQQHLLARGVETVVLAGVALEIGVDLSAKHALALGYLPVVVEDAVGSYSDELLATGLAALKTWIPVVPSSHVIEHWRKGQP